MDDTNQILTLDQVNSLYNEDLRVLLATLTVGQAGGINIVECNNISLRGQLLTLVEQQLARHEIYLYGIEISTPGLNLAAYLTSLVQSESFKELTQAAGARMVIFSVYGIEKLNDVERRQFFQFLNAQRNRLIRLANPITIWMTSDQISQFKRDAPRFWARKNALFVFSSALYVSATQKLQAKGNGQTDTLLIERYLSNLSNFPEFAVWQERYLPQRAISVSETVNLVTKRHTFTDEELAQLTDIFPNDIATIEAHKTILKKGAIDTETGCYVLLEGEVEVIVPDSLGSDVVISRLSRGDFFGEIAMVKSIPRTATVRSLTPCRFVVLTKPKLRDAGPQINHMLVLIDDIAERRLEALIRTPPDVMSPLRRFANQGSLVDSAQMPIDVFDLIDDNQKTILLGEAGTGKTTVLRAFTRHLLENVQDALATQRPVRLPVFGSLKALTARRTVEEVILDSFHAAGLSQIETVLDVVALLQGQMPDQFPVDEYVFVFDGLNEMANRDANLKKLNQFIQTYPDHQFVISCRSQDYIPLRGFKPILLQQLAARDIEPFLVKYMGQPLGLKVAHEILADPQLTELAQTPLALYMLAQITEQGRLSLPKNRGVLFERFTTHLLERAATDSDYALPEAISPPSIDIQKRILADLGLAMHQAQTTTFTNSQWQPLIPEQITDQEATISSQSLLHLLAASGLIRFNHESTINAIEFAHHTYQEFFAAQALRNTHHELELESFLSSAKTLRHWYGVIILLYGISQASTSLFSQILGHSNTYSRIWLAAQCLAGSGEELAVAAEHFKQQLPSSQHFAILVSVGLASYLTKRYPEALSYLLQAAQVQPGNAEVQYELGSLYRQVGQYERAIKHLEEAIHLRPDYVDAYNQLGITYYNQHKHEEALTIFLTTTHLEPVNAHHHYNLGTVQKLLKDYEAARNSFQMAVQLKDDYTEAQIQLDLLKKAFSSGVVSALKNIPMLNKLTLEQIIMLANRLNVVDYKAGEIVFHMGETGDTFYIIEFGGVEVLAPDMQRSNDRRFPVINMLHKGDFFGEIALLRSVPRTATIRCVEDTRLLELSRTDFSDIIDHYPSIAYSLAETSQYRLADDKKAGRQADRYYNFNYLQQLLDQQDEVTVLMGDIHGSTFLTNSIGPDLMVAFLDEYLLRMSTIIVNAGGAVDKSLGDSVMGVFGHFLSRPGETAISPAVRSLLAGLQMRQAYLDLREEWKEKSSIFMQTGMGIGINTGPVKIGTVGAEASMVGAAVNISNKLSKMAIKGRDESEIYLDEKTYHMLGSSIEVEPLDPSYVLKKSGGVELNVYRVVRNVNLDFAGSRRS